MATVRMKKGDKYADVYDSPETIRQAQLDGYSLVAKAAPKQEQKEDKASDAAKAQAGAKSAK